MVGWPPGRQHIGISEMSEDRKIGRSDWRIAILSTLKNSFFWRPRIEYQALRTFVFTLLLSVMTLQRGGCLEKRSSRSPVTTTVTCSQQVPQKTDLLTLLQKTETEITKFLLQ